MPTESFSDFFKDPATWKVIASGQAEGLLTAVEGPDGKPALRLDYDFHGGGGFVVARKEVRFELPTTFDLRFSLRGEGLKNNFEFKIADPGGSNAWRFLKEHAELPADWTEVRIRERDLPFAWGPAGGGAPKSVGAVELVVAAGPGGRAVCVFPICCWTIRLFIRLRLSARRATGRTIRRNRFSRRIRPSGWRADESDAAPRWSVDFGRLVRFGGLVIHWPSPMPAAGL